MDSDCPLFVRVMRDVVEERQAAQTIRPYLDDVETRRHLLVANYGSGSVGVLPIGVDGALGAMTAFVQHAGSGPNVFA